MNQAIDLIIPFAAGLVLGFLFFGGLLITVVNGIGSRNPALWFFISMLLRTGIVLAGFYWVGQGEFVDLLACLAGFIVARTLVTRKAKGREMSVWEVGSRKSEVGSRKVEKQYEKQRS